MSDEGIDLLERSFVEEDREPLTGRELATLVLGFDAVCATTLGAFLLPLLQVGEAFLCRAAWL